MSEVERARGYVVDASTAIKLFLDDPLSDHAHVFFNILITDPKMVFYVPDLFYVECTNVLRKYVCWGGLSLGIARDNLSDLFRLGLTVTSTADLMLASLELAYHYSISVYDACYVALAAQCNVPFVTADEKLTRALPDIIWLGDLRVDDNR